MLFRSKYRNLLSNFSLYHNYDALVSVSSSSCDTNRKNLAHRFSVDPARFRYADNVFDDVEVCARAAQPLEESDATLFSGDGPVFLTIGRLSPEQDHAKLIRAFPDVLRQRSDAKLLIVGYGPLHGDLLRLAETLGVSSGVHLLGLRDNPLPLLAQADCFVLSSNYEGKPVTLYEAMALRKPIISTALDGTRDALADGGGYLVENNQQALATAMLTFVDGALPCPPAPSLAVYREKALTQFYNSVLALPAEVSGADVAETVSSASEAEAKR